MSHSGPGTPDVVIRGGEVIDGSGAPRFFADVVLRGDTICAVVPPGTGAARQVIDAQGLVVCPGFIDAHSHDDQAVLQHQTPHPKLTQGVCTVVTGNCGISLAPLVTCHPPAPLDLLGAGAYRFAQFADYLAAIDDAQPCVNVAALVGHITLRVRHVTDLERPATAPEVQAMKDDVSSALDAGAFGLSTGVYYPPARACTTEELHGVCAALRGRQAVLAMHLRDEGDHIDAALQEAFEVGAACGAHLVLSHHKVVGAKNHGRTRETLRDISAAARKQTVCMDCYPYDATSTMLVAQKAARVGHVLITWSGPHPECNGQSLQSIAKAWCVDAETAAQRLMPGGAIYFALAPQDVERVLQHPLAMIGSDGLPHDQRPHPRLWGTFPRVLGHYSRERKLFPLEVAVHKMTGLPARRFGLHDRGRIAAGAAADVVLFDPAHVNDNATYDNPQAPASGIEAVWVNGRLAMRGGAQIDSHAGRRLRP